MFNTLVPLLPLVAGHGALALAGVPARHDVYAAIMGTYLLWAAALIVHQLSRLARVRACDRCESHRMMMCLSDVPSVIRAGRHIQRIVRVITNQ